jgi:hypothetical protein
VDPDLITEVRRKQKVIQVTPEKMAAGDRNISFDL